MLHGWLLNNLDENVDSDKLSPLIHRVFGAIDDLIQPSWPSLKRFRIGELLDVDKDVGGFLESLQIRAIAPDVDLLLKLFTHLLVKVIEFSDTINEGIGFGLLFLYTSRVGLLDVW